MKTAISLPDALFRDAERLAARLRKSRTEIYRSALEEYVARHDPDPVRETLDRVLAELGDGDDDLVRAAAERVLKRTEW